MKFLLFVVLMVPAANGQWYFFGFGGGKKAEPVAPVVVDCVIQPRDFRSEPKVERKHWDDPCVLENDVTDGQLANVKDPEGFLNARVAHFSRPTTAVFVNLSSLLDYDPISVNPAHLVDEVRARIMASRVAALIAKHKPENCEPAELAISSWENAFSKVDYRTETRRPWAMGSMSMALVSRVYASGSIGQAESRILQELNSACRE